MYLSRKWDNRLLLNLFKTLIYLFLLSWIIYVEMNGSMIFVLFILNSMPESLTYFHNNCTSKLRQIN